MSNFVALSINNKKHVGCAVGPLGEELQLPPNKGGWGLGYYQAGELLSRIEPRENDGEKFNAEEIFANIDAEILLLHTREPSVGLVRRENTHPFHFQHWMMAHNGTFAGFDDYKAQIVEVMPPYIKRGLRGDTDSEHLFYLFLSFLHDAGQMNRSNIGTSVIMNAIRQSVSMIDTFAIAAGHKVSNLSLVVSDGYSVVVLGRGVPVYYALVEGVRACGFCRNSGLPGSANIVIDHNELRAVLFKSGPSTVSNDAFQRLDENTFIAVTTDYQLEFKPLSPTTT